MTTTPQNIWYDCNDCELAWPRMNATGNGIISKNLDKALAHGRETNHIVRQSPWKTSPVTDQEIAEVFGLSQAEMPGITDQEKTDLVSALVELHGADPGEFTVRSVREFWELTHDTCGLVVLQTQHAHVDTINRVINDHKCDL